MTNITKFTYKNKCQNIFKINTILNVLFLFYLAVLVWIILFKFSFSLSELDHSRHINLLPFRGYLFYQETSNLSDLVNNVLIFIPFGIYMGALFPQLHCWTKILTFFLMSLGLESLQYIMAVGRSDITDVITNTLGGTAGLILFFLFALLFRTKERAVKAVTVTAFTCTAFMSCFLLLLIMANR